MARCGVDDEVDPDKISGVDSGGNDRLGELRSGGDSGVSILAPTGVGVECLDRVDSSGVDDADSPVWPTGVTAASTTRARITISAVAPGGDSSSPATATAHKPTISHTAPRQQQPSDSPATAHKPTTSHTAPRQPRSLTNDSITNRHQQRGQRRISVKARWAVSLPESGGASRPAPAAWPTAIKCLLPLGAAMPGIRGVDDRPDPQAISDRPDTQWWL